MSFPRPTLEELVDRIRADFRGRLSIVGPLVRRAMAEIVAVIWAGAVHMVHGHLDWIVRQLFADTAEEEFLLRIASLYDIARAPATFATGTVNATGTNGSVIPEDTILVFDAVRYRVTADATISAGTAALSVQAVEAGGAGNLPELTPVVFESPIAGVQSTATVALGDGISNGFDQESIDGVRDRLLLRLRLPPEGGADHDYVSWVLAVPGVTRVWVYRHEDGLGTVVIRFVLDEEEDIFPSAETLAAAQAVLNAQRPTTADVRADIPLALPIDFTIEVTPNTAAVHAAIEAELKDLLVRDAEPGDGAGRGTVRLSRLLVAIGIAEGLEDFTLTVPAADVVPGIGELAVLGTVTWA